VLKKLAIADLVDWKHRNELLFAKNFPPHFCFSVMLSVAVACTTGTSLCSCSRYQRQRRLCSMHIIASWHILN